MGRDLKNYIEEHFQNAMEQGHIQPYYQCVIRTASRQLCSFEALARWIDPALGTIYPDEFIPVLEDIRAIHLLDGCILRQCCARLRRSIQSKKVPVPVSVNLSRLDFVLCDVFALVDGIVSEYQIPHDFIYLEITESLMAEDKDALLAVTQRFRDAGYQIWMDDFGSGYSSLNVLKDFAFDELKLDMGFLRPFSQRSRRIVTALVEMAKRLGIHTLVEGVETEEQFAYLRDIGCEKVQGYYFGKPMPYDEAIEYLASHDIHPEMPHDRKYYDDIGLVDYLSAAPFLSQAERDRLTGARQLNSIPLALVEVRKSSFSFLFTNAAFEETARDVSLFGELFRREALPEDQPTRNLPKKLLNLMDDVRLNGEGRMLFTDHDEYYEIQAKCVASLQRKYSVLLRLSNLSKSAQSASTERLDEFLRHVYALYERITLFNRREDTITPLYTDTREDILSGRKGILAMTQEYARFYIFPDDREGFLRLSDPRTVRERFLSAAGDSISSVFRTNVRHGQYVWKEYTVLQLDEDSYILLIRNIHDAMMLFSDDVNSPYVNQRAALTEAMLWRNLVRSAPLRVFWKDENRRFLGASQAFLDYYGFASVEDIRGKNDEDLGWHVHPGKYKSDEEQVIREGLAVRNVPGLCMKDGENREILATKMPLYDDDGAIRGLMGYFFDKSLLTGGDKRGGESKRRDVLTGLLNSRGLAEEALDYRDEYLLRGVDFARIHVEIDDFDILNEQYGLDFGDKVLIAVGAALKKALGRTCTVGRYSGHRFVVFCQAEDHEEALELLETIKALSQTATWVEGAQVTLYLSAGLVMYSEYEDLEEQARRADERLLADHDHSISLESRLARSSEIFHLFDELPVPYAVYRVTEDVFGRTEDATIFYVNRAYEQTTGHRAELVLGQGVRKLYPYLEDEWLECLRRAAYQRETVRGMMTVAPKGGECPFTAQPILYPGYCAVTFLYKTPENPLTAR